MSGFFTCQLSFTVTTQCWRTHTLISSFVIQSCVVLASSVALIHELPPSRLRGFYHRVKSLGPPVYAHFLSKFVNGVVGMNLLEQKSAADAYLSHKLASEV